MYGRVNSSNGELQYYTRKFICHNGRTYSNPSEQVMNAEGWYLVPDIPDGKIATSWELVDGVLTPTLVDAAQDDGQEDGEQETQTPSYQKLSKLKLIVQLKRLGLYNNFFKWLIENDLREEWEVAQELRTDNELYQVGLQSLISALGINQETANTIIENSILEEDN